MRNVTLILLAAATAASCTTAPQPEPRSDRAAAELQRLLAGRVAGKPESCLPRHRSNNMVTIDANTIAFREGRRVWVNNVRGSCHGLGWGGNALVTRDFGGRGLCSGDIAQVVNTSSGMPVGSCVLGDFVPYSRP